MLRAAISRLARQPVLAALVLFLVGVVCNALPALRFGAPLPALHDEFGYLFLGETFARGRLTNDPPPGPPEFFETFHEFITPRYIAKFPPGQGIALAVGILLGHPIFGIWLVSGLWMVALVWMLRAAAPPGWAIGGALTAVIGYGVMTYWGNSYWGGSVMALGGALTFGGALRLWQREGNPIAAAIGAGVGCAIMALTRPFDGFVFALFPTGMIAWTLWRDRAGAPVRLAAFCIPTIAGITLLLGYNLTTTGSPWQFAHQLYDRTHVPGLALFVWDKPAPDPPGLPDFLANYERGKYGIFGPSMGANPLTLPLYLSNLKEYIGLQFNALFPIWIWPLVGLGVLAALAARDGPARLALLSLLFISIPLLTLRFYGFSHYAAAWTAPAMLLLIRGAQPQKVFKLKPGAGSPALVWLMAIILALWPVTSTANVLTHGYPQWEWTNYAWVFDRELVRQELAERAEQTGRPQMAIVVYGPDHNPHIEWVFNSPDVLTQDVLWIRALGPARVPELARLFPQHDEWLVYVKANGTLDHRDLIFTPNVTGAKSTSAVQK